MVTAEIGAADGLVFVVFTDGRDRVDLVMTPDEARELCNSLGEAIQTTSRATVMT